MDNKSDETTHINKQSDLPIDHTSKDYTSSNLVTSSESQNVSSVSTRINEEVDLNIDGRKMENETKEKKTILNKFKDIFKF